MKYDLSGTTSSSKYNLNAGAETPVSPGIQLTDPNFKISQSSPSIIPQENPQPFENTKIGIAFNTLKGLLTPAPYLKTAKDIAQGTARSIGSAGVSIANFLQTGGGSDIGINKTAQPIEDLSANDFQSNVAKDIFSSVFGNEPVPSLEKRIASLEQSIKSSPVAQKFGLDKAALPLAFGGILGDATLNLTPIGGEENLIKNLAKESDAKVIYKTLLKTGITEDLATHFAPEFAQITNPKEAKSLFDTVKGIMGGKFITENFGGDPNAFKFNTPGFMTDAEKAAAMADIQQSTPKSDVQLLVDELLSGKKKLAVSPDIKREKIDTLGGRYQYMFRNDPNLQTLDGAAGNVGLSGDELLQEIAKEVETRKSGSTNITGSQVGQVLSQQDSRLTTTPEENPLAPGDNVGFETSYSDNVNPETGNVNPPAVRGGLKSPELNFSNWNDKNTFSLARETFERNIEQVANPEDAAKLKEFIVDPIRANEDALVKFTDKLKNDVKAFISEIGIKAGTKEDRLIQQFGEGLMSLTELEQKSPDKWKEIQQAAEYFRGLYDMLLDKVNVSRAEYGYKPIPKRPDYFRHFQEVSNVVHQLGILFREQDLPTEIAGITDIFKPGKPFTTAELARKGTETTVSAVKGFDNYIESVGKQIFHIDSVQRVRALEKYIRAAAGEDKASLPAFVANLNEYGNLLAGKAAKLDRAVESVIGRRMFRAANIMKQQTGISMVATNISSALTNFIPFTQSLATTEKPAAIKGILDAFISPFTQGITEIDGVTSNFLLRRFKQGKISPTLGEKILEKGGWLFKAIDGFVSHSVVAGKYYENVAAGMAKDEAMKAADTYAGKVLADRSFGQLPNLMGSKTAGFVTQFQTEVNNMYSFLTKDIPNMNKDKKAKMVSAFAQFVLYSYFINDAYQYITGRRPTVDPIYAGLTLLGQTDASQKVDFTERAKMAAKDVAGNLPFGNLIPGLGYGGRLPIANFFPDFTKLSQGDLTELLNPVSLQLKKSIQGVEAYNKGKVTTPAGKLKFRIPQTNMNFIRSILFGTNAIPQSNQYYDKLNANRNPRKKVYNL